MRKELHISTYLTSINMLAELPATLLHYGLHQPRAPPAAPFVANCRLRRYSKVKMLVLMTMAALPMSVCGGRTHTTECWHYVILTAKPPYGHH